MDIYKASAGSGKTFTLAREYIRIALADMVLRHGGADRSYAHILAVTFTKKATAEMKERILSELNILATNPKQSAYYADYMADKQLALTDKQLQQYAHFLLISILQDYSSFAVSTIDGFFQQVIRRFARELGLPATYDISLDGEEVVETAIDQLMEKVRQTPKSEQSEWLRDFALQNISDQRSWMTKEDISRFSKQLLQEKLQNALPELQVLFADKEGLKRYDQALRAIQQQYIQSHGKAPRINYNKITQDEEVRRYNTATCILKNIYQLGLLQDVAAQVQATNRELNRLPISEINTLLSRLIDNSEAPFLYERLGQYLHHFMMDEFQDTSRLQWSNFYPLVKEAESSGQRNLIVGDTKQSIYRWRNSEWKLLEQMHGLFDNVNQPLMRHNFRSSAVLVDENNQLFSRYRDFIAAKIDNEFPSDKSYGDIIRTIYTDERLHQKAGKDLPGCFRLQFFEGKTAEVMNLSLEAMLPIIRNLQDAGVPLGHIAVLVRKRNEAQEVASFLVSNGYDVQSADGLLIESHPAIQLIVTLLLWQDAQDDPFLSFRLNQLLQRPMTDEERDRVIAATQQPLYDQVQTLIDIFSLSAWDHAMAYILAFQDTVYHFIQTRVADRLSFLEYWNRHRTKLTIPGAQTTSAIHILTVHASKGLEYEHVFIPFLTWPLAKPGKDDIIWCCPKEEPFNQLPLVPVQPTALMANSLFYEDYANEMRDLYIDNLNITYVAFTRASQGLYAFGMQAPTKAKGDRKCDTIGHLLSILYQDQCQDGVYEVSNHQPFAPKHKEDDSDTLTASYHSLSAYPRLILRARRHEITDLGTRMHELLSRIRYREDEDQAFRQLLSEGWIKQSDMAPMQELMQSFWHLVNGYDWFDKDKRVLLEQDLLCPSGKTYRPDRVIMDGQHATIIDYKFGNEKRHSYNEQVRDYMTLYQQMGYQTSGYLIYVQLNTIVPV